MPPLATGNYVPVAVKTLKTSGFSFQAVELGREVT
jgi:hypothetical protein